MYTISTSLTQVSLYIYAYMVIVIMSNRLKTSNLQSPLFIPPTISRFLCSMIERYAIISLALSFGLKVDLKVEVWFLNFSGVLHQKYTTYFLESSRPPTSARRVVRTLALHILKKFIYSPPTGILIVFIVFLVLNPLVMNHHSPHPQLSSSTLELQYMVVNSPPAPLLLGFLFTRPTKRGTIENCQSTYAGL